MFNRILKSDWYKSESHYIAFLNKECIKISLKHLQLIVTQKNGTETCNRQTHKDKTVYPPHLQSGGIIQMDFISNSHQQNSIFQTARWTKSEIYTTQMILLYPQQGDKNLSKHGQEIQHSLSINMYLYLEFLSTFIFLCTNNRGSK